MTDREFINSGCENKHAEFRLKNGTTIYGILIRQALSGSERYYFITSANMQKFNSNMVANDKLNMQRLSIPIDIGIILTAKIISLQEDQ